MCGTFVRKNGKLMQSVDRFQNKRKKKFSASSAAFISHRAVLRVKLADPLDEIE